MTDKSKMFLKLISYQNKSTSDSAMIKIINIYKMKLKNEKWNSHYNHFREKVPG